MAARRRNKFLAAAIKHPGALRATLHTPAGKNIPAATLAKAAKRPGVTGQRARLAQTMRGFRHGGRKRR